MYENFENKVSNIGIETNESVVESNGNTEVSDSTSAKINEKRKLGKGAIAGIISGAIVLIIVIIVAIFFVMQGQATEKYNNYVDNLEKLASSGLQAASAAEDICNTTKRVWNAAIWKKQNEWDADIAKYYASDFNDALALMYADTTIKTKISNMKSDASDVESIMSELKNPPDLELEEAYQAAKECSNSVETLVDMAADPSGSLQTFSSNFSKADDEAAKAFKNLTKEIPDKR